MAEALHLLIDRAATPLGELVVVADREGRLRAIDWTEHEARMRQLLRLHYGAYGFVLEPTRNPGGLTRAMRDYFEGDLAAIDGLPAATAGTPFQRAVWRALREIQCGTTISYRTIAERI